MKHVFISKKLPLSRYYAILLVEEIEKVFGKKEFTQARFRPFAWKPALAPALMGSTSIVMVVLTRKSGAKIILLYYFFKNGRRGKLASRRFAFYKKLDRRHNITKYLPPYLRKYFAKKPRRKKFKKCDVVK